MGAAATKLTTDDFLDLLLRADWETNEQWRAKNTPGYEVKPFPARGTDEYDDFRDEGDTEHWYGGKFEVNGYTLKDVAQGGGEDRGSSAFIVYEVTAPDGTKQWFRKEGYYASHYGYDWDGDLYEVKPQERTVTFYEDKV